MQRCSHTDASTTRVRLEELAAALIDAVLRASSRIEEGYVMTMGPPPYRRLDCGGRALCYVRVRPTKDLVRVDISRLWSLPAPIPVELSTGRNKRALLVRSEEDVTAAATYLAEVAGPRAATAAPRLASTV